MYDIISVSNNIGGKMTKSSYLSSAAKYFAIVSALILLPNLFSMLGTFEKIAELTGRITGFSFYLIIVLIYVALNGEGIAYRKNRLTEKLRATVYLKRYLLFSVIINFSKNYLERKVFTYSGSNVIRAFWELSSSFLFSVTSFSFVVTVVLIWYLKRDKEIKGLAKIEMTAIISGVIYNLFKALSFPVESYGTKIYGEALIRFFSFQIIGNILCVLCCIVFIITFIVISKKYTSLFEKEEEERKSLLALRKTTKDIYKKDGYGIDSAEDDFILNEDNVNY